MKDAALTLPEVQQNLRFNATVNILDGAFFGFGLGFASFTTVLPLFVATFTDSPVLIGLIPAIHSLGWQLPQLLTARRVALLPRLKRYVIAMTVHERVPFLALALVAWLALYVPREAALWLAFACLVWQGLGGGFTANAWQNLIGKVIPGEVRGTFYGAQSAAASLLASLAAVLAGLILDRMDSPIDFVLSFTICGIAMGASMFFISLTREPRREVAVSTEHQAPLWQDVARIWKGDRAFRWYIISRMVFQFGLMASAFYIVYGVKQLGMSELTAGVLTSVLFITQVAANPTLGWLADRWSRKWVMTIGVLAGGIGALLAFLTHSVAWYYPIMILQGIANTVFWTIGLTLSIEFGSDEDRPTFVGMANTLIAPSTILAPLVGGWIASAAGYPLVFLVAAVAAVATTGIMAGLVSDPNPRRAARAAVE